MKKVCTINKFTGIETRSAIGTVDHPMANMDRAPTIGELCSVFLKDGVALAVTACRKALHEAHLQPSDITHVVSTTCTNSANPGNGIGGTGEEESVYDLLGWEHKMIPDTEHDLGFDVDPLGWKVILSPRVPKIAASRCSIPQLPRPHLKSPSLPTSYSSPADFDWALHPGGATILTGVEKAMHIQPEHMRASYDTYMKHGKFIERNHL
ncbi:hypothetical protein DID88_007882 [Monilinia fructigena]|uniref:Chalcone/stilbene synthase C-terminal domain-containing protein n=1 Tax=Monilinia fructigena TaxID=38457 RepID=A0A395J3Q0_9HELO|nr:hypothetical protein DID88_007882 [Monilinia fructigena]